MPELTEQPISCPYRGETITILVDNSLPEQEYVEDCESKGEILFGMERTWLSTAVQASGRRRFRMRPSVKTG